MCIQGYPEQSLKGRAEDSASTPAPAPAALFFEVEDTGIGIASHEINHLFQVFSQAEAGQKTERGLGLGLFISHRFVRMMGGDMTLVSTPKQQTIVRFYILAHSIEADQLQPYLQTDDRALLLPVPTPVESPLNFTQEHLLNAVRTEISTAWLTQLHEAAIKGFDHQITQLIQAMPATYAPLAKTLTAWNQNFQFDRIVTITQKVLEQTSDLTP